MMFEIAHGERFRPGFLRHLQPQQSVRVVKRFPIDYQLAPTFHLQGDKHADRFILLAKILRGETFFLVQGFEYFQKIGFADIMRADQIILRAVKNHPHVAKSTVIFNFHTDNMQTRHLPNCQLYYSVFPIRMHKWPKRNTTSILKICYN